MRYVLGRCRCTNRGLWSGHGVVGELSLKPTTNPTVLRAAGLGGKTSRGDERKQLRGALPKNLIRPLLVQDRKGEWFRRPALPFTGARRRSGWSSLRWRRRQRGLANP